MFVDSPAGASPEAVMAHVLFIDMVGSSQLATDHQPQMVTCLQQLVQETDEYQKARPGGDLVSLPTGDGMALVFFRSPEQPAGCAIEIALALRKDPFCQVRMGIHSGPVFLIEDIDRHRGGGHPLHHRAYGSMQRFELVTLTPRSTMEGRAAENRHWTDPSPGPETEPDTRGRVRCPPCCARKRGNPSASKAASDGVVFSTAATERPVAAAGPSEVRLRSTSGVSQNRSSCASPAYTGLTPPSSFPCVRTWPGA